MLVKGFQQALTSGSQGQLDISPVARQIASIEEPRLDKSIADPAGGGQMYAQSFRYARRIQMARLRREHKDSQLRQGDALANLCNGFGRNGAKDSRRTQKGFDVLWARSTPLNRVHGATSNLISCLVATISLF